MVYEAPISKPTVLQYLRPEEYEHPLDRKALNALEGTPGLEPLIRKLNQYGYEKFSKIQYTGSNLKITSQVLPEIYEILLSVCEVINLKQTPDLYVQEGFEVNAMAVGSEKPIIVLNEGAIEKLTPAELTFIIGHEVGHIKSQHMVYHYLASSFLPALGDAIGSATFGVGSAISTSLQLAILSWYRKSEFSCDRAGLLACQDVNVATTAFMKIAGAPEKYYDHFDPNTFIAQAKAFEGYDEDKLDKVAKVLSVLQSTHPWTVMRGAELYKWIDSGSYHELLIRHNKPISQKNEFCMYCGKSIENDAKFCIFCGSAI